MLSWLVLAAALSTALFPGGLMPKWAGPCGKALCECAPVAAEQPRCERCVPRSSAAPRWTFAQSKSFEPRSDTVAFQIAFSSLDLPAPSLPPVEAAGARTMPRHESFALIAFYLSPSLRPPRA